MPSTNPRISASRPRREDNVHRFLSSAIQMATLAKSKGLFSSEGGKRRASRECLQTDLVLPASRRICSTVGGANNSVSTHLECGDRSSGHADPARVVIIGAAEVSCQHNFWRRGETSIRALEPLAVKVIKIARVVITKDITIRSTSQKSPAIAAANWARVARNHWGEMGSIAFTV